MTATANRVIRTEHVRYIYLRRNTFGKLIVILVRCTSRGGGLMNVTNSMGQAHLQIVRLLTRGA